MTHGFYIYYLPKVFSLMRSELIEIGLNAHDAMPIKTMSNTVKVARRGNGNEFTRTPDKERKRANHIKCMHL